MEPVLSIVMPAYNEEGCVNNVVTKWTDLLNKYFKDENVKLIVINDGSKDKTGAILDELSEKNKQLLVVHQINGGHGKAVVNGYKKAIEIGSQWVFQVDSDDQFFPDDFIKLWKKRNVSDFILGFRKIRYDAPIRLVITRVLRLSLWLIFGCRIKDSNIPFRLIKGSYLNKLVNQLSTPPPFAPNIFIAVLAKKSGQQLLNIPITHIERKTGTVSILQLKLLKVCVKSFEELFLFRAQLSKKIKSIQQS